MKVAFAFTDPSVTKEPEGVIRVVSVSALIAKGTKKIATENNAIAVFIRCVLFVDCSVTCRLDLEVSCLLEGMSMSRTVRITRNLVDSADLRKVSEEQFIWVCRTRIAPES